MERAAPHQRQKVMIDILYLAKGRPEFADASFLNLVKNTAWNKAGRLFVYTDGDHFPLTLIGRRVVYRAAKELCDLADRGIKAIVPMEDSFGGPVAIMSDFLSRRGADIFAKIDNDVIVPPGWLEQCLSVMEAHPELDLLGIEPPASRTPAPWAKGMPVPAPEYCAGTVFTGCNPACAPCDSIGGIGLMRRSAFAGKPPMKPHGQNGVGGFTDWQLENAHVCKGWIVPPLSLFLLDRLPFEPWLSLSKKYIAQGIQRPWTNYPASASHLWEWWLKKETAAA